MALKYYLLNIFPSKLNITLHVYVLKDVLQIQEKYYVLEVNLEIYKYIIWMNRFMILLRKNRLWMEESEKNSMIALHLTFLDQNMIIKKSKY